MEVDNQTRVPANLVERYWRRVLWETTKKELYWNKFIGEGPNSIITKMTDLKKEAGDRIVVPLLPKLIGPGVTGDDVLEGNEEPLMYQDFSVVVDQIRHATIIKGRFEEQKTQLKMRRDGRDGLSMWLKEKIDYDIFKALSTTASPNRQLSAGSKAENLLTDTDKFTASLISRAKRKAKLAGSPVNVTLTGTVAVQADSYIITGTTTEFTTELKVGDVVTVASQERIIVEVYSDTSAKVHMKWKTASSGNAMGCKRYPGARCNMRPVNVDGQELFVMVIHPWQERDLWADPVWYEAQKYANVRGSKNPIFTGMTGIYDGCVIHSHENINISLSGASGANVAHSLFLGAQACGMAIAQEPEWVEDERDYKNKVGISTGMIWGAEKAKFNGEDFACLKVLTGAAAD
ncbi:N4-gp56 family major capsid protein [Acetonema longum]|uniref:N4-gp56 family major capsid protein n=1 Tax=Acetonema longum DSM 6540 TaxID=1009370 RepID=F7NK58_9FIRM|nr:N4-gp56 family major capsid protein [Acetonema longum]EGO63499.1 hypothetical protein ALO_12356 [Acetonema longum DSM 6540]